MKLDLEYLKMLRDQGVQTLKQDAEGNVLELSLAPPEPVAQPEEELLPHQVAEKEQALAESILYAASEGFGRPGSH